LTPAEAKARITAARKDPYGKGFPEFLRIKDKQGVMRPFVPNSVQQKVARNMSEFTLVIKPRRDGVTSLGNGIGFWQMMEKPGQDVLALNMNADTTQKMFERVRTFFTEWPAWMKAEPERNNVQKLQLKHRSSFDAWSIKASMGEEEADKLGRSFNCNFFHGTEVCFWEWYRAILNGTLDTLPEGARILLESTGNGAQGGAYEDFMEIVEKGEPVEGEPGVYRWGDRTAIFLAWFENPERRMEEDPFAGEALDSKARYYLKESELEHMADMKPYGLAPHEIKRALYWRRARLKKKGFFRDPVGAIKDTDREYPGNYRHAFQTSGHAFLSLTLTDTLREAWKAKNKLHPPLQFGLVADGHSVRVDPRESWLTVWDAPILGWRNRYSVGGDVGGGHPDGDRDCIWVKDRATNKMVAVAHGNWGPQEFARRLLLIAKWYDNAQVIFETNNHGTAVQVKVFESEYANIYKHDADAESYKGLGWLTNEKSRKDGLDHLKLAYEDQADPLHIPYDEFYTEAAAFAVKPGKTKPEGQGGVHDDLVLGAMVCEMGALSMPPPERVRAERQFAPTEIGGLKQQAIRNASNGSKALVNY
jgi:hypothetical protein